MHRMGSDCGGPGPASPVRHHAGGRRRAPRPRPRDSQPELSRRTHHLNGRLSIKDADFTVKNFLTKEPPGQGAAEEFYQRLKGK